MRAMSSGSGFPDMLWTNRNPLVKANMKGDANMEGNRQPAKVFVKKRSVVVAGIALSLMVAQSAYAQSGTATIERIEVTGTRIPPPNLEGPSPVTSVDAQSIRVEGLRSAENLLNNLPQVFADQGGNISNGATGTATVNLRNFGADRTLVLVNGRRVPAGSPTAGGYAADLNQIPLPLVKRVDVLTGGASAIYGSDAVAGVVNFILNDKFEGAQFQVNQSFYNHDQGNAAAERVKLRNFPLPGDISADGQIFDANMLLGGNFGGGKGNATVFFTYKKEQALMQSERDFSACAFGNGSTAAGLNCGGSGTSYPGRFIVASGSRTVADSLGNTRPYVAATDVYNFAPLNYYQRPSERYGFNAAAHYEVTPKARVYGEFGFHDDSTIAQIAPSGLFGFDASGANAIRFENPLLSADWRTQLGLLAAGQTADAFILRRNVEGGGRQDDIRHSSYRSVIGVKGELPFAKNWNYDAFMQFGKVIFQESYKNDFSITRAARAMNVVTDPATGLPACQSKLDGTDPNCVPYDIWRLGGVTQDALNYLQTPGLQRGSTSQSVQGLSLSADLGAYGVKLPLAKNGVSVAFGLERRTEKLDLQTDTAFSSGDLFGQGGPTVGRAGQYTVSEYFLEGRAPLIEGRPMAHLLSVNASYRNSDYTTGNKTDSYGLGIEWAPVREARLRGSYQRAARHANANELFTAQGIALYDNDADPCAGATPIATLAQCARTGVTAAQYGTIIDSAAGQYNYLQGGNPNLKPETSDSYTAGLVFTPMTNFNATLDVFSMKVSKVIDYAPPTVILQQCIEAGQFCDLITRDRLGTLWASPAARIVATNQNLGSRKTSGVDVGANYTHRLNNYGRLTFNFLGTYLKDFKFEPIPGLGDYDCAGLHGPTCGTPLPQWRHKLRALWSTPWNFDVALTWRYMGSVDLDSTSSNPQLTGPYVDADKAMGARDYFDLYASWAVTKQLTVAGGINNMFDKDPPISGLVGAGYGNGNTYPQVYDALGRRIYINLTAKF